MVLGLCEDLNQSAPSRFRYRLIIMQMLFVSTGLQLSGILYLKLRFLTEGTDKIEGQNPFAILESGAS